MSFEEPDYIAHLNPRQKEAVLTIEGPVSVLAGAGSGKTSVLTTRIYHLIRLGIPAENILAVTFTNKAAREMRERLQKKLPDSPLPLVATFHGLGRELLQTYGSVMDIPRHFSIFDRDDSKSAIRQALKALDVDPKEIPPSAILGRISKAKSEGQTLAQFREKHGRESFRSRIVAEAWVRYEETLKKEKALDFDDLIVLPVRMLRDFEEVRAMVQRRFSHLHIDEYQDTNELQGKLAHYIAGDAQNLFVVGDIDQCVIKGTLVTMSDGMTKKVENIKKGDLVLSNYGNGSMRSAEVIGTTTRAYTDSLITIKTIGGKILTSTPEHIHFAGFKLGHTPQLYFTYLMHKKGVGWRLGVSQTYTNGQRASMIGFQQRCNQEHGDEVWVVQSCKNQQEARIAEYTLSLQYGIPTIPFVARKTKSPTAQGYVHDQGVINTIFSRFNTEAAATKLLQDTNLSRVHPHHRAQATRSDRRNIVIALCGESRSTQLKHRISMVGSDAEGAAILATAGYSVRKAKEGSASWRYETAYADYAQIQVVIKDLCRIFPYAHVVETARLGGNRKNIKEHNSLPFIPAASVIPGMVVFTDNGDYALVESVQRMQTSSTTVYDLNIKGTHNFIANGLVTHNSIYTWRGATIDNLLKFEDTYEGAKHVVLEHNYRSTKTIVDAANSVIEKNQNRKDKHAITDNAEGDLIVVYVANNAEGEAQWIAREARKKIDAGLAADEIAVLFRTNFQSRALEEAFLHADVPYRLLGTRFFDRKEVKDVLSWIRLALDPSRETDRIRAVQSPPRGIGKVTLGKMVAGKRDTLRAADGAKVAAFEKILEELNGIAQTAEPSAFVKVVIEKSGMAEALRKEGEEGEERLMNVQELATLASRHDDMPGMDGIANFLAEAALAGDQDEMDRDQTKKGVTLMTVHAAKGLEFNTVFVTGLEEGLFPHEAREDQARDEEEERRLFYVAITRAKLHLVLTLARVRRIYGTDFFSAPSSFISEIDQSLLEYQESDRYHGEDYIEL